MATTLQSRVADLIGTVSDLDAVKDALNTGCRFIVNLMSDEILEEISSPETVSVSGLSVGDFRLHYVHKSGYGARKVLPSLRANSQDTGSIHYALPTDPVYTIYDGKIYVYPSGGTAMKVSYPSVTTVTATSITGLQTRFEQLVVYYAAIQLLFHIVNEIYGNISTIEASIPDAIEELGDPEFSYTDIGDVSVNASDISAVAPPTYTKPTFSGSFTTLGTTLDTREDITLSEAHLGRITQYLNQYRADIENEVNEFSEELEIYKANIQAAFKYSDNVMTAAVKNQDIELQSQVAEYRAMLDKHATSLQSYSAQVQTWAVQIKTKVELLTSKLGLMKELQAQFKILLEVHLGVK